MKKYLPVLYGALAFVLPLGLYVRTLSPTYIPIDSAEFTMCMKYWGMCHPPGFPLYIALGHFFLAVFPFGSLVYKANFFSALFASLTVLFVYLGQREFGVRRPVAFLVSLFFAVSSVFWEYSVSADVFSFATFLMALSVFLMFRGKFLASVFVLGLSSSHFYITAVLAPVYYWYKYGLAGFQPVGPSGAKNIKNVLISSLVFLSAFFPQALMYWRMTLDPAVNWGHARGLGGFYYYLRRQEFGSIFLIANPVLTFHISKFLKHFETYFPALFVNFGVVLPLSVIGAALGGLFSDRKAVFIFVCFWVVLVVQLFLLSTIDPTGADNPFQISKFYLTSFVIFIFLAGKAVDILFKKFFDEDLSYVLILISFLVLVYFISNFRVNDLSKNYFSRDMVLDAFSQLPPGSIAVTVSHIVNFGGRYEQEVEGRFGDVTILYFPNEKNRDNEFYHPEVFGRAEDKTFIDKVKEWKSLGKAEEYVLSTIAKNLDRPIYILQGSFEEGFFAYLKPYIKPYGMWWKVEPDLNAPVDTKARIAVFDGIRNKDVSYENFELKAQRDDTVNYAISYHSTGVMLGSFGMYDEAIGFMEKSLNVRKGKNNVEGEITLLKRTRDLDGRLDGLVRDKNKTLLLELGNNLYNLQNYKRCVEVYSLMSPIWTDEAAVYNNWASCLAMLGVTEKARELYKRALVLDPNLSLAKQGLDNLDSR